jgi:hypothetical protein
MVDWTAKKSDVESPLGPPQRPERSWSPPRLIHEQGRDADHSLPSRAEVKNPGAIFSWCNI